MEGKVAGRRLTFFFFFASSLLLLHTWLCCRQSIRMMPLSLVCIFVYLQNLNLSKKQRGRCFFIAASRAEARI